MALPQTVFVGEKYGRLTVISWSKENQGWLCNCDCGNTTYQNTSHLRAGNVLSCGCYRRECDNWNGGTQTYEFSSFLSMHQRAGEKTNNPIHRENYYDKGITVCDRWSFSPEGFANFLEDMGERPTGMSLERKRLSEGYSPENCCWDTDSNQCFNRSLFSNNKSGHTGVIYAADRGKWRAWINKGGKRTNLGQYATIEEAIEARRSAEVEFYPDKVEDYRKTREK